MTNPTDLDTAIVVIQTVSKATGVSVHEMESRSRTERIAWARALAMHLIAKYTGMLQGVIGALFNRTQPDVCHAVKYLVPNQLETKRQRHAQAFEIEMAVLDAIRRPKARAA